MCCVDRRSFLGIAAASTAGLPLTPGVATARTAAAAGEWDPTRPQTLNSKKVVVQPLLRHEIETPKPQRSWRNWGGVHTRQSVAEEVDRIGGELEKLKASAGFPIEILPLATASSDEEAGRIREASPAGALILYAAGAQRLDACVSRKRDNIIFVRHRSGPVYDWYENVSNRFLRAPGEDFEYDQVRNYEGVGVDDVVVDDYGEILWRLRAIHGLRNFIGSRAVTIGRATGKGCPKAPDLCRQRYGMEIVEVPYVELDKRLRARRASADAMKLAQTAAGRYLAQSGVAIETDRVFVANCFLLYSVFKELMQEHNAQSFTIMSCMSTVMPIAETTACLALSMMQDEGLIAFCESDFGSHPAGVLLRYITGNPVFMHNPTFPHNGIVTCAHCTCPRRMNGKSYEPVRIKTHYESDYGASPKIQMPVGQQVTIINPDCAQVRWLGFRGRVADNPSLSICRSQQDIEIEGDWRKLAREMRGSHWMMAYGDFLKETGYCMKKMGLDWMNISEPES
jgi:hypothetical protein